MFINELYKPLVTESKEWKEILASYRDKINQLKSELYNFAPGVTDHKVQLGKEHFHNQFHIQLVNIHDLKHKIKQYINVLEHNHDLGANALHEEIKEKVGFLVAYLDKLEAEFHNFIKS